MNNKTAFAIIGMKLKNSIKLYLNNHNFFISKGRLKACQKFTIQVISKGISDNTRTFQSYIISKRLVLSHSQSCNEVCSLGVLSGTAYIGGFYQHSRLLFPMKPKHTHCEICDWALMSRAI